MSLRSILVKLTPARLENYIRRLRYYRVVRDRAPDADAQRCRSYLKPGDMVIDVGANIGLYTRMFADCVGPQGSVHAVEPIPETFDYLTYNMKKMGLKNVFLYYVAAAGASGDSRMSVPRFQAGYTNIYESRLDESGDILVKTMRLDDLFPDSKPAFIKIDVEGHEAEVIRGAETLLRTHHPALLVEVTSPEAEPLLAGFGYRRLEGSSSCDHFFVYDAAASQDLGRANGA